MKRKHTQSWLKRHVVKHSTQYSREFARQQMKRFIEQNKRLKREANQ